MLPVNYNYPQKNCHLPFSSSLTMLAVDHDALFSLFMLQALVFLLMNCRAAPCTANMSLDIQMKSEDLLQKEQLDVGGFGMVSLCYHKNHGLVVLKTVYTGPKHTE